MYHPHAPVQAPHARDSEDPPVTLSSRVTRNVVLAKADIYLRYLTQVPSNMWQLYIYHSLYTWAGVEVL